MTDGACEGAGWDVDKLVRLFFAGLGRCCWRGEGREADAPSPFLSATRTLLRNSSARHGAQESRRKSKDGRQRGDEWASASLMLGSEERGGWIGGGRGETGLTGWTGLGGGSTCFAGGQRKDSTRRWNDTAASTGLTAAFERVEACPPKRPLGSRSEEGEQQWRDPGRASRERKRGLDRVLRSWQR